MPEQSSMTWSTSFPPASPLSSIALARPARAGAALRAALRDHGRTPSPNSGWPMAALAGALNIRLEKPGYYVLVEEGTEPETSDVPRALCLSCRRQSHLH